MSYELVKLTSKGQLTLPKEYRDKLRLEKGSHLTIAMKGDALILKKVYNVKPLSNSDPIWDMVGMFEDISGAGDIAAAHDAYTAEGELAG